jgi:transcriptional antiterminator NusG
MKRWYVVQVYAGYEESVKTDLLKRIQEEGVEDRFGEVLIPSAKLKQLFGSIDQKDEQLFPGYVLVQMEMAPETKRIALASPRVLRFLGGLEPAPLTQKEIDQILSQMRGEITVSSDKEEFVVGREVDIKEGPFAGFVGVIEKVDKDNDRLTVMVSIFGRMTPVELGFHQVQ